MRLTEKYRPRRLDDIAGQPKAVSRLRKLIPSIGGRVLLFIGPSGTGKTSTAIALGREIGVIAEGESFQEVQKRNLDVRLFRGGQIDKSGAEDIADWIGYYAFNGGKKMVIIDEAQNITESGKQALLNILEILPDHVVVVLTTTGFHEVKTQSDLFEVKKSTPFGSRCKVVKFEEPDREDLKKRLAKIAWAEIGRIEGVPYPKIADEAGGNIRAAIDLLEDYILEVA